MPILQKLIAAGAFTVMTMSAHAYCSANVDKIRVVAESAPVNLPDRYKYKTGQEVAQMTKYEYDPASPVYGATSVTWSNLVSVTDYAVGVNNQGQPCVAVKAAKIKIQFKPISVFIADFLREYACMREHVIAHEYLHVDLYRNQLKNSLTPVAQGVHDDLKRLNGFPIKNKSEAEDVALDHLSELATKHLLAYRDGTVNREQDAIDAAINYADHKKVCNGEALVIEAALAAR